LAAAAQRFFVASIMRRQPSGLRRRFASLRTTRRLKRCRGIPGAHSLTETAPPFKHGALFSNISQAQGDHFCNDPNTIGWGRQNSE
jgi:hypothetical protein